MKTTSNSSCTSIMIPLSIGHITVNRVSETKWSQSGVLGIDDQCDESYECAVNSDGDVNCTEGVCSCLEGFHATRDNCVADVKGMCL